MWFLYKDEKLLSENAVEMEVSDTYGLLFEALGYEPVNVQFYNELTKNWASVNVKYWLGANLPCQ